VERNVTVHVVIIKTGGKVVKVLSDADLRYVVLDYDSVEKYNLDDLEVELDTFLITSKSINSKLLLKEELKHYKEYLESTLASLNLWEG
jgi:hypothetical protein